MISLAQIAAITGGQLIGEDRIVSGFSTDSRHVEPDQLFIALVGERFDAHDFCNDANAAALLVSRQVDQLMPQVLVPDTQLAMQQLAQAVRHRASKAKVVALTGSAGKTTTREMLALMMSGLGTGVVTQGNLNNDIGVPLTLFRIQPDTDWAVIECGASKIGDIGRIAPLAEAQVTILLNALDAHIGKFGSLDNIRLGKGEIIAAASETVVLNKDDPAYEQWLSTVPQGVSVLTFAMQDQTADVYVSDVQATARSTRCIVHIQEREYVAQLNVPGVHLLHNFMAALLAATAQGVDAQAAIKQVAGFNGFAGRMQFVELTGERLLIDDSYNASPASVYAAIDVLSQQSGKKVLALGDLGELGDQAESIHQQIGRYAQGRVDELLTVGNISRLAQQAFDGRSKHYPDNQALINQLDDEFVAGSALLVKGSRAAAMDEVAKAVCSQWSSK